jgi:hypothetical protein
MLNYAITLRASIGSEYKCIVKGWLYFQYEDLEEQHSQTCLCMSVMVLLAMCPCCSMLQSNMVETFFKLVDFDLSGFSNCIFIYMYVFLCFLGIDLGVVHDIAPLGRPVASAVLANLCTSSMPCAAAYLA